MAAVQTDFLRGITHDLQTPLTSIRARGLRAAAVEGARRRPPAPTWRRSPSRRIGCAGWSGQLLAVSRLEVGALTPVQEVFRAGPVVQRTWDALRAADHQLVVEEEGPPHLVVADPDRLEQVLWALMDNAVKYSPAGSTIRVHLGLDQDRRRGSRLGDRDHRPGGRHGRDHASRTRSSSSSVPTTRAAWSPTAAGSASTRRAAWWRRWAAASTWSRRWTSTSPSRSATVDKPFLMPIEDVFSIKGRGTVGTGRIERGRDQGRRRRSRSSASTPTRTRPSPASRCSRRRSTRAQAGDNVGVLLRGVEKNDLERGQVICKPGSITPHTKFEAEVYVLSARTRGAGTPRSSRATGPSSTSGPPT